MPPTAPAYSPHSQWNCLELTVSTLLMAAATGSETRGSEAHKLLAAAPALVRETKISREDANGVRALEDETHAIPEGTSAVFFGRSLRMHTSISTPFGWSHPTCSSG